MKYRLHGEVVNYTLFLNGEEIPLPTWADIPDTDTLAIDLELVPYGEQLSDKFMIRHATSRITDPRDGTIVLVDWSAVLEDPYVLADIATDQMIAPEY